MPNTLTTNLQQAMAPYMTPDLQIYLNAITQIWDELDSYVGFDLEEYGWSALLDPDLCPAPALPYLAQYVGERLPEGIEESMAREWIKDAPNQRRGTLMSIVRAVQRTLEGSRTVSIVERSGTGQTHPEDYLTVMTYTDETPNSAWVYADLRTVVPADIDFSYNVLPMLNWAQVKADNATWQVLKDKYTSWVDLRTAKSGYSTWTRPRPIGASA